MVFRFLYRILGNLSQHEKIVDKLADSKPIRRAAQLTAYTIVKAQKAAESSMKEFQKQGGSEKLKQVAKSDINEATRLLKEFLTYDLPKSAAKFIRDIKKK